MNLKKIDLNGIVLSVIGGFCIAAGLLLMQINNLSVILVVIGVHFTIWSNL